MTTTITMMMTATVTTAAVGKGLAMAVLKTEPAAAAEVTVGAAINQQRAAKMTVAAIAVGKRHQARG